MSQTSSVIPSLQSDSDLLKASLPDRRLHQPAKNHVADPLSCPNHIMVHRQPISNRNLLSSVDSLTGLSLASRRSTTKSSNGAPSNPKQNRRWPCTNPVRRSQSLDTRQHTLHLQQVVPSMILLIRMVQTSDCRSKFPQLSKMAFSSQWRHQTTMHPTQRSGSQATSKARRYPCVMPADSLRGKFVISRVVL